LYDLKTDSLPISLWIKSASMKSVLQIKILTRNDSTVLRGGIELGWNFTNWKKVTIYRKDMPDGWGGTSSGHPVRFAIAIVGADTNTVLVRGLVVDNAHALSTFEPNPVLPPARTAQSALPLDTLVIKWMERIQDNILTGGKLLAAMEDNNLQTYTNALSAMAFILVNKPERAERILSFYDTLMDSSRHSTKWPSFYKDGKPAGLFQSLIYRQSDSAYVSDTWDTTNDRWTGDMAWLLLAYRYYQSFYSTARYTMAVSRLSGLLTSLYKTDPASGGGFIQIGWQDNDTRFDSTGHVEGNIDCYAALRISGETSASANIKNWLSSKWGNGLDHPLDEYTWRVLAFGPDSIDLALFPENDYRFWKEQIDFNGKKVDGVYCYPLLLVDNIFIEGSAHLACAYYMSGNETRANYYSNLLDQFIMEKDGVKYLPYVANGSNSDFAWVDLQKGMASTAAWYVIAKSGLNPMRFDQVPVNRVFKPVPEKRAASKSIRSFLTFDTQDLSRAFGLGNPNLSKFSTGTIYDVRGRLIGRVSIDKNGRPVLSVNNGNYKSHSGLLLLKLE
jgi:hypothetical protein